MAPTPTPSPVSIAEQPAPESVSPIKSKLLSYKIQEESLAALQEFGEKYQNRGGEVEDLLKEFFKNDKIKALLQKIASLKVFSHEIHEIYKVSKIYVCGLHYAILYHINGKLLYISLDQPICFGSLEAAQVLLQPSVGSAADRPVRALSAHTHLPVLERLHPQGPRNQTGTEESLSVRQGK